MDAIQGRYGIESRLVEGSGGVFDVRVDGHQIWDKMQIGRFPEHQEIFDKIDAL